MRRVGRLIGRVIANLGDEKTIAAVRAEVGELARSFPLYANASASEAGRLPAGLEARA
jgi:predicted ABC-type transport system involved in lysophospholipase L1 biosynthesis ATPase subunit